MTPYKAMTLLRFSGPLPAWHLGPRGEGLGPLGTPTKA